MDFWKGFGLQGLDVGGFVERSIPYVQLCKLEVWSSCRFNLIWGFQQDLKMDSIGFETLRPN